MSDQMRGVEKFMAWLGQTAEAEKRVAALDSPHLVDALESLLDTNDWRNLPSREMAEKMIVLMKLAVDLAAAGREAGESRPGWPSRVLGWD